MEMDLEMRLSAIEKKLTRLVRITEDNSQALGVLYRRTIALGQMVEAVAEGREPRITQAMRAEIDASLHPQEFLGLLASDPHEFVLRYGERAMRTVKKSGLRAVGNMGDLTPEKRAKKDIQ